MRQVGQSSDGGADVIGHRGGKRWLFQVKKWNRPASTDTVDQTLAALRLYRAEVPVVVSMGGFTREALGQRRILLSEGIPLQLWDRRKLLEMAATLPTVSPSESSADRYERRPYQENAIEMVTNGLLHGPARRALVVLATGLGKTYVAAESIRRARMQRSLRVLAIAHTNPLVYQLERAFWPTLTPRESTLIWNGLEHPPSEQLDRADNVFACIDSLHAAVEKGWDLAPFDVVLVDECHHAGAVMYQRVLRELTAGAATGPFLLGLTATPWRPDGANIEDTFGEPLVTVDLVTGLRRGFLAEVDYRMYTDNVDWKRLSQLSGKKLSPKSINRTLFIHEWDDAVVDSLQAAWGEQASPRAIVFCGNIDHALRMRDRINALGFTSAEAIYSGSSSVRAQTPWERNRVLSDFEAGDVGVICTVDIFNEGVDVPDVNIIVFQRVTHSRRIFIQQLGRGLRLSPGKRRAIVLDFVSDIRRFAAGLELKDDLEKSVTAKSDDTVIRLNNRVKFLRSTGEDPLSESFLREWLEDVAEVERAGEDASLLKFPPEFPSSVR